MEMNSLLYKRSTLSLNSINISMELLQFGFIPSHQSRDYLSCSFMASKTKTCFSCVGSYSFIFANNSF